MKLLLIIFALALATPSGAFDLGATSPAKPNATHTPPPPDPDLLRQGGDTIADAVVIALPVWNLEGTTTGYTDDHDEACPYPGSTSPDVVYAYTPDADLTADIDMLGSSYDTKIYVYDADLDLVACNDDWYPDYVSRIEWVDLVGGATYYLVIDGYGGESGDYVLAIRAYEPCILACPPGGYLEGEPPLVDDYLDAYNGGCNSPEFGNPFQHLHGDANGELILCGTTGWYQSQGNSSRDTDWFVLHAGDAGVIEVTGDAERPTYLWEMAPQDCGTPPVMTPIIVGTCAEGATTIVAPPSGIVWYWIGPTVFTAPDGSHPYEYDYVVHFVGLQPAPVANEAVSWSAVKGLFH